MKKSNLKTFLKAVILLSVFALPSISSANSSNGVSCPSGYTSQFKNNVLRCYKTITSNKEVRKSSCPFRIEGTVYHAVKNGKDYCTRNDNGKKISTVPHLAIDIRNYRRVTKNRLNDIFIKGGKKSKKYTYAKRR